MWPWRLYCVHLTYRPPLSLASLLLWLLQIKGTAPIQIGTYATVIGGLIGVGVLAYLGLKL